MPRRTTERINITKDWLQQQIIEAIRQALGNHKESAALRGYELLARLNGHIIDKSNVRVVRSFSDMTDEELQALVADAEAREQAERTRH